MSHLISNIDAMRGLEELISESIDCVITSPPYYNLREYRDSEDDNGDYFGIFKTPEEYVSGLCDYFDEVYRSLKPTGVVFVNLGDTYLGSGKGVWKDRKSANKESFQFKEKPKEKLSGWRKPKQLALIPFRFAIEMQNRGWILRNNIAWIKPNAVPQSVIDRYTQNWESVFMFVKSKKYHFNVQKEIGANDKPRQVRASWEIATKANKSSHTATFPEALVERMILSGCPENGNVLDFFSGTGTTGVVAKRLNRHYIGFELNKSYYNISLEKINNIK